VKTQVKNKQLFMNIYDIIPTEPWWDVIEDKHDPPETWYKEDLLNDIRENGFSYQLNVDPNGTIRNGNGRYWAARQLLEDEHDERFRYLPVQRNFATGLYHHPFKIEIADDIKKSAPADVIQKIYDESIQQLTLKMFTDFQMLKDKSLPVATQFEEYPIDPEDPVFLKTHWEHMTGDYVSLYCPHPQREHEMVFVLILEGHRSFQEAKDDIQLTEIMEKIEEERPGAIKEFHEKQSLLVRMKKK
jgi:hypothetical protein